MTEEGRLRERQMWMAAVAVLVTTLGWLALINGLLLVDRLEIAPRSFTVVLALLRVLVGVARTLAPLALVGALMALVVAWIFTSADPQARERGARHV